jgi:hypothetical protein
MSFSRERSAELRELRAHADKHGFDAAILQAYCMGDEDGFTRGRKDAADELWRAAGKIKTNG